MRYRRSACKFAVDYSANRADPGRRNGHTTSITASPSPSTVKTARWPLAIETVGYQAAGDDAHTRFEPAAAFGDMVGEPGQGRARILGLAFTHNFAVDRETAGNAGEATGRQGFGRAGHDAAVPAILHDQRQGLDLRVIRIAILDQLEGGHRRRHRLARPRRAQSRQVVAELERFRFRCASLTKSALSSVAGGACTFFCGKPGSAGELMEAEELMEFV